MHIFTDHCVHNDVITALQQTGFKVTKALDKKLDRASDDEIFHYIVKNKYILLTFDKDFGNIIRFNIKESTGIVIAYVETMNKEEIVQRILEFFKKINPKILKSSLFIIELERTRVWRR